MELWFFPSCLSTKLWFLSEKLHSIKIHYICGGAFFIIQAKVISCYSLLHTDLPHATYHNERFIHTLYFLYAMASNSFANINNRFQQVSLSSTVRHFSLSAHTSKLTVQGRTNEHRELQPLWSFWHYLFCKVSKSHCIQQGTWQVWWEIYIIGLDSGLTENVYIFRRPFESIRTLALLPRSLRYTEYTQEYTNAYIQITSETGIPLLT